MLISKYSIEFEISNIRALLYLILITLLYVEVF